MIHVTQDEQHIVITCHGHQIVVPLVDVPTLIMNLLQEMGIDDGVFADLFGETEVLPVHSDTDQSLLNGGMV